jgi:hypothetical protein
MDRKTREHERLAEARRRESSWKKWGPYLSERQWGTVREHMSTEREAWEDFSHDQARSRAYHWGEDGIAGFCDDQMLLCFSLAFWNERDAILKERLFGLTNGEGNHGEDAKEYWFYLDSTPTHSYAKMLYKYPQAAFPYTDLLDENRRRSRSDFEYELLDTKVFDEDRYWDVFIEYAKASPEEILVRITAFNRGPERAALHILPHLWFRNTWFADPAAHRPHLEPGLQEHLPMIAAHHLELGTRFLYCDGHGETLFTDNETNNERLFGQPNATPHVKDGINDFVVSQRNDAVNPACKGTKAAFHRRVEVDPGKSSTIRLRLTPRYPAEVTEPFGAEFDRVFAQAIKDADEFYAAIVPAKLSEDVRNVIRQGYGGLLWTKQAYLYDVESWLRMRGSASETGNKSRNWHWSHMQSADIISMPDKWEYPWFAAWDLAFHALPMAMLDPDFAAQQMELMLLDRYQHPNGQLAAYEWNFGDVNPPVHAWASLFNYRLNRESLGDDAIGYLRRIFHKLLFNFTWWLNRKDRNDKNVFEGGFLGLDNIGVFDRSAPLPTGGYLEQADGTAWMALFSQNMLDMALELALVDPVYEDLAVKFYEHFIRIAAAVNQTVDDREAMWDEKDGFFYDVLRVPGQWSTRLAVRSMVGLLPLCAVTVYRPEVLQRLPKFVERVRSFRANRPDLFANLHHGQPGVGGRYILSLLDENKLRRVLARMLDPEEFLGEHGIRSLSRFHRDHPYVFNVGNQPYRVSYLPAESDTGMFGGNSNWRGPVWAPVNGLIVRALLQMYTYYGDDFRVECPTGSGHRMNLYEVAQEISNRLLAIFLRDVKGRRPVYGGTTKFQEDPHWRDHILFYEYFHGDNGAGLGASHQTGWTATIPMLAQIFGTITPQQLLASEPLLQRFRESERIDAPGTIHR